MPARTPSPSAEANMLRHETSPYLLQHQDNPVNWRAWGPAVFEEAAETDKPVLLSIGYAACHWCHVMAHESFEDPGIAEVMNELFVNVKVDREERPDVDGIYQHALQLLGEQGGWPLTMFLTAEGEPFWGGTYFPNEPRYGRPGFTQVLTRIAEIYRDERAKVLHNAGAMREALNKLAESDRGEAIPVSTIDRVAGELVKMIDPVHGGIGGAPKFPQAPILQLLWRAHLRTGEAKLGEAVKISLDRMCQGGIYDHLGGGFARYSVDAQWLVPHFEKMLYDNAQLLELLGLVWQATGSRLYAERAAETVDWIAREMVVDDGGFAGTLDADSEGEEGKFYVWTEAEIDQALGPRAPNFKAAYDVGPAGNWEGKVILNRSQRPDLLDAEAEAALARDRAVLLELRGKRVRPALDDKVLTDWNGLMIAALARSGLIFDRPEWIVMADAAFRFVMQHMMPEGRLAHAWREGRPAHPATLDDHANMILGAIALHEATGRPDYLDSARAWLEILDRRYIDGDGAYFLTADDVDDVLVRQKTAFDNATPAGNAQLAQACARLYYLTGEDSYRAQAESIIKAFSGALQRNVFPFATLLNAADLLQDAVQVVVAGRPDTPAFDAMVRAVISHPLPNLVLQRLTPESALHAGHPAHGKEVPGDAAAVYVCRGTVCSLPISDPSELPAALAT